MATPNCIACAMLASSPTVQPSALVWNSRALEVRARSFKNSAGSGFLAIISKRTERHDGFRLGSRRRRSSSSRSISSSFSIEKEGPPVRYSGARGWQRNPESRPNSNSLTFPERSVVRANASRRNFLFQLGEDGGYEEGPIELPPRELEIDPLAIPEASPIQIAASFVLTGTIGVLLLRSLRRRAQRAKELKFRSTGVATSKSIKEDARKAAVAKLTQAPEVPVAPPSPAQTFFGAVVAGGIALAMYKVTTTVEASFVGKPISMNYSIRNLTITVRTIINGLLYLATFVFAANSIGLGLYSVQLLLGDDPSQDPSPSESLEKHQESSSEAEKSSEPEDKN